MAKLEKYKGSVEMQSGMKPMGSYPLMEAHDVLIAENGARLDEAFEPIVLSVASTGKDAHEALALYQLYGKKVIWEEELVGDDRERCEMIGFNIYKTQMYFLCTTTKQIITLDFAMAELEDTLEDFLIYEDIGGDIDESILAQINTNSTAITGLKASVQSLGSKDVELGNDIVALENDMNTRFANLPEVKDGETPYIKEVDGVKYWHVGDQNLWVKPTGEKGDKGDRGLTGKGFSISRIYNSVAEMNASAATDGYSVGDFVLVTSDVEDEDNAKLFVKDTASSYKFLTDMSGATGIQGVGIERIEFKEFDTADDGRVIDWYTIVLTNGDHYEFPVHNGLDATANTDDFVKKTDICDGLSFAGVKDKPLSAHQGAVLAESINELYKKAVIAVDTEAEMDEILANATNDSVGSNYQYFGITGKYKRGYVYKLTQANV
jgi:hypothetical protein